MILYLRLQKMLIEHLQRFTCILKTTVDKKRIYTFIFEWRFGLPRMVQRLKKIFSVFPGAITFDILCY